MRLIEGQFWYELPCRPIFNGGIEITQSNVQMYLDQPRNEHIMTE